jgi:hypothetical protein
VYTEKFQARVGADGWRPTNNEFGVGFGMEVDRLIRRLEACEFARRQAADSRYCTSIFSLDRL